MSLGHTLQKPLEIYQFFQENLKEMIDIFEKNYFCIFSSSSFFYQQRLPKYSNDETLIDKNKIALQVQIKRNNSELRVDLKSEQPCRGIIEVRGIKRKKNFKKQPHSSFFQSSFSPLIEKFPKQKSGKVQESHKFSLPDSEVYIKIVVYNENSGQNIFSSYWKKEEDYKFDIDSQYDFEYFFSMSFYQRILEELKNSGKGFNLYGS